MENRRSTGAELSDPEKTIVDSTSSFDLNDKDEALKLVGLERAESFTEEQYLRVRQKLVCVFSTTTTADTDFKRCVAGLGDPTIMSSCILFAILVSAHPAARVHDSYIEHVETRIYSTMQGDALSI